ncbi:MAG: GIY-YIG nuclease family protein [Pseudomonadota bacterium]
MRPGKGSYALILHAGTRREVAAGRVGTVQLEPGYYLYCGSAFGPGGVAARTRHHRRISERPHWHMDYLRPHLKLLEIWYTLDSVNREHLWTAQLLALRGASLPFAGFGASDCGCRSHLVRLGYKPGFAGFRRRLRQREPQHRPVYRERMQEHTGG